jgi:hypothetical protein
LDRETSAYSPIVAEQNQWGSGPAKLGGLIETDDRLDLLILKGDQVAL